MRDDDAAIQPLAGHRTPIGDAGLDVEEGRRLQAVLDVALGFQDDVDPVAARQQRQLRGSRTRAGGPSPPSRTSLGAEISLSSVVTGWPRLLRIVRRHSIIGSTSVTSTTIVAGRPATTTSAGPLSVSRISTPPDHRVRQPRLSRSVALEQVGSEAPARARQVVVDRLADGRVGRRRPRSSRIPRSQSAWMIARLWETKMHGPALLRDLVHLRQRLALEGGVADGEDLVDEQDLRLEVGGDREGEPHRHPARVALHRGVEEALDVGEGDDFVEAVADLGAPHAEDRAVEEDVLAAGQLRVEAGADLEQRADAPGDVRPTRGSARRSARGFSAACSCRRRCGRSGRRPRPARIVSERSFSAQRVSPAGCSRRPARQPAQRAPRRLDQALAQGAVAALAERRGCSSCRARWSGSRRLPCSDVVGEAALDAVEVGEAGDQQDQRRDRRDRRSGPRARLPVPSTAQRKPSTTPTIGLIAEIVRQGSSIRLLG